MENIKLTISEKITDEQLLAGKKINIEFETLFNGKREIKVFPDDFTVEQQETFKQVYEQAVYGSEVGEKIFRCENTGSQISISGYTRTEPTETGIEDFDETTPLQILFTRHGIKDLSEKITTNFFSSFKEDEISRLRNLGIAVSGTTSDFQITNYDGDVTVQVLKNEVDSYINIGDFVEGKVTYSKV